MRKVFLSVALATAAVVASVAAPRPTNRLLTEMYIEQYKHLAVVGQMIDGIPASITLAQAIIESAWGRSDLALKSNNHFGLKARNKNEPFVAAKDDEKDHYGRIISSRFKKFATVEESFQAHGVFLRTNDRYRTLFTFDRADYRRWAIGLQNAGYATNPNYAQNLIQCIETYKLYELDVPSHLSLDDDPLLVPAETPQYNGDENGQNLSKINQSSSKHDLRVDDFSNRSETVESDPQAQIARETAARNLPGDADDTEYTLYHIVLPSAKNIEPTRSVVKKTPTNDGRQ